VISLFLLTLLAGEVDGPGVPRLVHAHKGQTVIVSLWATWCDPCVKEFPWVMELARERKDIVFLAVSIDDPDARATLESFVRAKRPPFPVYARAAGKDDAFIDGVDPAWKGVVPTILIYDKDGRRAALLEGEHTKADVQKVLAGIAP
jgi:thiol-disulfide isomerase/thioredoxin